jgi:hypothetical protein
MVAGVVADLQKQGDSKLAHRVGSVGGDIRYHDPPCFGGITIDDIITGGQDADVFDIFAGGQGLFCYRRFVQNNRFRAADALDCFFRRSPIINGKFPQFF